MKKIAWLFSLILISLSFNQKAFAWPSETGGEVVSAQGNIVRASIEATQVLTSDVLALLYGTSKIGGASNFASFDSGGTLSFKNVVSSIDTVKFSNNEMLSWVTTTGVTKRIGVSTNNVFVVPASIDATGYNISGDRILVTSVNTAEVMIAGVPGRTSVYTVNTGGASDPNGCQLTFTKGILTSSNCWYAKNKTFKRCESQTSRIRNGIETMGFHAKC